MENTRGLVYRSLNAETGDVDKPADQEKALLMLDLKGVALFKKECGVQ